MKLTVKVISATALSLIVASASFAAAPYKGVYKDMPCSALMDGLYVGAQGGYDMYSVRNSMNFTDPDGDVFSQNPTLSPKGGMGGIFAGYGKYINSWFYLAGEAQANYSGASGNFNLTATTSGGDTDSFSTKVTTGGTYGVALLPGLRVNNNTLAFVRLGWNWSNVRAQVSFTGDGTTISGSRSRTLNGFNYGLGMETLVSQNWSVRGEYNYTNYQSFTTTLGTKKSPADGRFLAGVVYHIV